MSYEHNIQQTRDWKLGNDLTNGRVFLVVKGVSILISWFRYNERNTHTAKYQESMGWTVVLLVAIVPGVPNQPC